MRIRHNVNINLCSLCQNGIKALNCRSIHHCLANADLDNDNIVMGIDWLNTITVSISMAVDCMTVGATDGLEEPNMKKSKSVIIALFFGFFQFLMPTIGYFIFYFIYHYGLSDSVREQLENIIPWIAFGLLVLLGVKNIVEWALEQREARKKKEQGEEEVEKEKKTLSLGGIIIQSIATSIDALCIGFVYSPAQYDIPAALLVFGVIGIITALLSFLTITFGKLLGDKFEKWAPLIAGIVFIIIGTKILLEGIL